VLTISGSQVYALKIDLSFVQNMLEDQEDERVVKTIVSVAQAYGLTTIAEGVESEAVLGGWCFSRGVDL
jgi:EAL domain-containing protein (putative c-di-GMP-specific phosphodiesterase class I)